MSFLYKTNIAARRTFVATAATAAKAASIQPNNSKIMVKHIATVGIYVDDQPAAEKFWLEKVNFEVKNKKEMGNGLYWLEVGPKDAQTALVLFPKKLMPNYAELKPSIVFNTADIDATCAILQQRGVVFKDELSNLGWGKFASFLDPDGNEFGLREW
jgi:lactoylglutathione lyase